MSALCTTPSRFCGKLWRTRMGYDTNFSGSLTIEPPLNQAEIDFLQKFSETRRMFRQQGPYFVDGKGAFGQDSDGVLDYNEPPAGQPSLWCNWVPSDDGTELEWNGGEKTYGSDGWIRYLIEHFLKPGCVAKDALPFLQANHTLNGVIEAQGDDTEDKWAMKVVDNVMVIGTYTLSFPPVEVVQPATWEVVG
jgi:hypothetical protein